MLELAQEVCRRKDIVHLNVDRHQTESEEHDTHVPIVKTSKKSPTPQEVSRSASGIGSCPAQELVQALHINTWHWSPTWIKCGRR